MQYLDNLKIYDLEQMCILNTIVYLLRYQNSDLALASVLH